MAVDAIDYNYYNTYQTEYSVNTNASKKLVHSPYFKTNIIEIDGTLERDYSNLDSFVIYMCVEGSFEFVWNNVTYNLSKGETILLPSIIKNVLLKSNKNTRVLEAYL